MPCDRGTGGGPGRHRRSGPDGRRRPEPLRRRTGDEGAVVRPTRDRGGEHRQRRDGFRRHGGPGRAAVAPGRNRVLPRARPRPRLSRSRHGLHRRAIADRPVRSLSVGDDRSLRVHCHRRPDRRHPARRRLLVGQRSPSRPLRGRDSLPARRRVRRLRRDRPAPRARRLPAQDADAEHTDHRRADAEAPRRRSRRHPDRCGCGDGRRGTRRRPPLLPSAGSRRRPALLSVAAAPPLAGDARPVGPKQRRRHHRPSDAGRAHGHPGTGVARHHRAGASAVVG